MKSSQLKAFVANWITGKAELSELENYKNGSDAKSLNGAMLSLVLEEEVFSKITEIGKIEQFIVNSSIGSTKAQASLSKLIAAIEKELGEHGESPIEKINQIQWTKHHNLVKVIICISQKYSNSLSPQLVGQILDYLLKLIHYYKDDNQTISSILTAFEHFSFVSLVTSRRLLLGNVENTNHKSWEIDEKLCKVMKAIFMLKRNFSLGSQTCSQMLEYIIKVIETCDHNETINLAWDAMRAYPFIKYQSSLLLLIKSLENQVNAKQPDWSVCRKLCELFQKMMQTWKYLLSQETCLEMFDFLIRFVDKCEEETEIDCAVGALMEFPFEANQVLLKRLLNSMQSHLNPEAQNGRVNKHDKMRKVLEHVMQNGKYFLSHEVSELMFGYLLNLIDLCGDNETLIGCAFDGLSEFPFEKHQSSLVLLVDSFEQRLREESSEWVRHQKLCKVLWQVLKKHRDSLNQHTCGQLFDYLVKVIVICDNEETIDSALNALRTFPFDKYQTTILMLIDLVENTAQYQFEKHEKLCEISNLAWKECNGFLSEQTIERVFEYIMKLIDKCDNLEMIDWSALNDFQFEKYQFLMIKMLDSVDNQLNTEAHKWHRHQNMCSVMQQVLLRCRDSLSNEIIDRMFDYIVKLVEAIHYENMIDRVVELLSQFLSNQIQFLLIQTHQTLLKNLQSSQVDWRINRNWAIAIEKLLLQNEFIEARDVFNENFCNILFGYFITILDNKCEHMPTKLFCILTIENLYVKKLWRDEQMNLMRDKLFDHISFTEEDLTHEVDFYRYQVRWCAKWFIDNVMGGDGIEELPMIKLSNDRFSVRNDTNCLVPVRASFSVTTGVYYYEVIIVTNGEIHLGWNKKEVGLDLWDETLLLNRREQRLISYDVTQKYISPNRNGRNAPDWEAGDVIGCLIDCDESRFVFYYEGEIIEFVYKRNGIKENGDHKNEDERNENERTRDTAIEREESNHSSFTYCATALLSPHQQCVFNFGQLPFKCAPKNVQFKHFQENSGGDLRKYKLAETGALDCTSDGEVHYNVYWFKHLPVDNQVDLFYRDEIQDQFDKMTGFVLKSIQDIDGLKLKHLKKRERFEIIRYIQSIINVIGREIENYKIDVIAQWIGQIIDIEESTILKLSSNFYSALLELLYPYIKLRINSTQDYAKHRHICIVLSHLIKFSQRYFQFMQYIRREAFAYLTQTLYQTGDEWTQMFALIALDNLELNKEEKIVLREYSRHMELLNRWKDSFPNIKDIYYLTTNQKLQLSYQLHFTATHFLTHVLNQPIGHRPNWLTLKIDDQTEDIKLSPDLLSARSDSKWQSVRSACCDSREIYYFEVVLLTNGPMRIGWSTKRTELGKTKVGEDDFSIGFDGYSQCVWHRNTKYSQSLFPNNQSPWKAGDVIGCYILKPKSKKNEFLFTLNGKPMGSTFSSTGQFYPALSLSAHQQVMLNLGQTKFKYWPKGDGLQFTSLTNKRKSFLTKIQTKTINARNSSTILQKDHTFECITCPLCHKEILLKRFMFDCCACLKLSMKTPTGNRALAITSNDHSTQTTTLKNVLKPTLFDNNNSRKRKHIEDKSEFLMNIFNKRIKLNEMTTNSTKPLVKCQLCDKPMSTKRVRFECCDHLKFCFQCGLKLDDCLKCRNMSSTSNSSQVIECQHCGKIIRTRPHQCVDCDHGKMCRDCVKVILDCPRCIESANMETESVESESNSNCKINGNQIEYFWEIKNFTSFFYDNDKVEPCESEIFPSDENAINKFQLKLYPNGVDKNGTDVSMFLHLDLSSQMMIEVKYKIEILNWKGNSYHTEEGSGFLSPIQAKSETQSPNSPKNIGFPKYIACDRLLDPKNGLLVDDTLTICCEIIQLQTEEGKS